MKKTSALRKQFTATKKTKDKIKKGINSLQAEESLRESEEKYRNLVERANDGIAIVQEGLLRYTNVRLAKIAGYSVKEVIGKAFTDFFTPAEVPKLIDRYKRRMLGEKVAPIYETVLRHKNGSSVNVELNAGVITYEGKPADLVLIRDITERKEAEMVLQEKTHELSTLNEQLEFIMGATKTNTDIIDADFNLIYVDRQWQSIYGNPKGRKCYEYFMGRKQICPTCGIPKALKTKKIAVTEEILPRENNRVVEVHTIPFKETDGSWKVAEFNIDITERKRTERELSESEERLRLITENMSDMIRVTDFQGVNLYSSPSHFKGLGYRPEERINKSVFDILHPDDIERCINLFSEGLASIQKDPTSNQRIKTEYRVRHADGHYIWLETVGDILSDAQGKPMAIVQSSRDISDRKQAEETLQESEERFRLAFEKANTGMCLVDLKGNLVRVNNKMCEIFGYAKEELERITVNDIACPEDIDKSLEFIQKSLQGEKGSGTFEKRYFHKKGHVVTCEVVSSLIRNAAGSPLYFISHIHDITKRKQSEEALRESEAQYRLLANNIKDQVWLMDLNLKPTYISPSVEKLRGYTFEEIAQLPLDKHLTAASLQSAMEFFSIEMPKALADPTYYLTRTLELEFYCKDGSTLWLESTFTLIRDENGKPLSILGAGRDITENRLARETLQKSEERMKSIFRAAPIGIGILVNRVFIDINDQICKMTGYRKEELIGASARVLYPTQADFDYVGTEKYRQIAQKGIGSVETHWKKKDGTIIDVLLRSTPFDLSDLSRGVTFTALDISVRKQTEKTLRESEEKYRNILESIEEGYYEIDLAGNFTFVNDSICQIYGYPRDELIGMNNRQYTTEETAKKAFKVFNEVYRTGKPAKETGYEIIGKDGTKRYIASSIALLKDSSRKTIGFRGFTQDITERKQAEEALYQSEEKYRTILENIEDGYYETDLNGDLTFFNDSMCKISAYPKEELMGINYRQYTGAEDAKKLFQAFNEVYRTGEPTKGFNWQIIRRDGTTGYFEASISLLKNSSDKPVGFRGIIRDITERKRAEEELLRSEEKYRSLVENAQESIYQSTADGRHLTINPAFARMIGYDSPEEVMATITDIARQLYVNPDDRKKLLELVNEKGSVTDFETEFYKKDGNRIWVSISIHAVRDDKGNLLYYQGIDQDITERKKMETERKENIERLRKSLGATVNAMAVTVETRDPYTAGHQRKVADLARAIATEMNLGSDMIDGVRMASIIHDIGKISIPSEILTKPTELTNLEYNLIKTHPESGYNILKDIEFPWPIARIVLQHHERINGSGYPNRLTGEQILLESKIIAIADVVEAISSHRPYRAARGIDAALDEISKNKGILYEPGIVDACLRLFREKNYKLAA